MEQQTKSPHIRFTMSLIHYVSLTLFAMLVWHVTLYDLMIYQQENNVQLAAFITKKKIEVSLFEKRQKKIEDFVTRIHFIAGLQQQNMQTSKLLSELSKAIPPNIMLSQLRRQNKHIILEGNALSDLDLIQFMQNLNRSAIFMQPVITSLNTTNQMRNFQLKFEIEP